MVIQRMIHRYLGSAYGSAESVTATEFEGKDKDENSGFDKLDTGAIAFLSSDLRSLLQHPSLIEKPSVESTGANIAFGGKEFMDYTSLCLTKVLHGIDSPRTPVLDWYLNPMWGGWRRYRFTKVWHAVGGIVLNCSKFTGRYEEE